MLQSAENAWAEGLNHSSYTLPPRYFLLFSKTIQNLQLFSCPIYLPSYSTLIDLPQASYKCYLSLTHTLASIYSRTVKLLQLWSHTSLPKQRWSSSLPPFCFVLFSYAPPSSGSLSWLIQVAVFFSKLPFSYYYVLAVDYPKGLK